MSKSKIKKQQTKLIRGHFHRDDVGDDTIEYSLTCSNTYDGEGFYTSYEDGDKICKCANQAFESGWRIIGGAAYCAEGLKRMGVKPF